MGNHHPNYLRWCLALWIARDLPLEYRKENPKNRITDKMIRAGFINRYEHKHGNAAELKKAIRDIYTQLQNGIEPKYEGPYSHSTHGITNRSISND